MERRITGYLICLILLLLFTLPLSSLGRADKPVDPPLDNPNGLSRPEPSDVVPPLPEPMPGSYQPVQPDDTDLVEAVYYLKQYYVQQDVDISGILIHSAERQVVAGTKYRIHYHLMKGDILLAEIFLPLDGADPLVTLVE